MHTQQPLLSPDTQGIGAGASIGSGGGGAGVGAPAQQTPKIVAFDQKKHHEDTWKRSPNVTGTGAIHVRTFHCKLGDDAIGYLDQMVNEWLDSHPQYEVKFVTNTIGEWSGKLGRESHLVVQVWV